ncbi:MAG: hypothetical protein AAB573_02085 [Patescibacteria group bacterium]
MEGTKAYYNKIRHQITNEGGGAHLSFHRKSEIIETYNKLEAEELAVLSRHTNATEAAIQAFRKSRGLS